MGREDFGPGREARLRREKVRFEVRNIGQVQFRDRRTVVGRGQVGLLGIRAEDCTEQCGRV